MNGEEANGLGRSLSKAAGKIEGKNSYFDNPQKHFGCGALIYTFLTIYIVQNERTNIVDLLNLELLHFTPENTLMSFGMHLKYILLLFSE